MYKLSIFIAIIIYCTNSYGQSSDEQQQKSIAVIVELNQSGNHIESKIYQVNVFSGNAKNLYSDRPAKAISVLRFEVVDDLNNKIFEGYFANPLKESLESFEENGIINNNMVPNEVGYVNFKFPIENELHHAFIKCYLIDKNNAEELISTLNLEVQ